jgi:hypothetical protein
VCASPRSIACNMPVTSAIARDRMPTKGSKLKRTLAAFFLP